MRRKTLLSLAAALALGCTSSALAQNALDGVTMRVLDDVKGIDAVILDLAAGPAETEAGTDDSRNGGESAAPESAVREGADRGGDDQDDPDAGADDAERGEQAPEDNGVEREEEPGAEEGTTDDDVAQSSR